MKFLALALVCGALSVSAVAHASKKTDQRVGRENEAALACISYLHGISKDPDSFQPSDDYTAELGTMITHNDIFIYINGRGKNTFGAVLQHTFKCDVVCKKGVPCHVDYALDNGR